MHPTLPMILPTSSGNPAQWLVQNYSRLVLMARHRLASEPPDPEWEPHALVHETWMRMERGKRRLFRGERHFLAVAATTMRCILIDQARRRSSQRRGGAGIREKTGDIDQLGQDSYWEPSPLREALEHLSRRNPPAAKVTELHAYGGLTLVETAKTLGITPSQAKRCWQAARDWLRRWPGWHVPSPPCQRQNDCHFEGIARFLGRPD